MPIEIPNSLIFILSFFSNFEHLYVKYIDLSALTLNIDKYFDNNFSTVISLEVTIIFIAQKNS